MERGMRAAVEKLEATEGDDIGALLKAVGMALVSKVGGAAGPLYGTLFLQMGSGGRGARARSTSAGWVDALEKGVNGVQARGKAQAEDKTMLDALLPAVAALRAAADESAALGDALQRSAEAAEEGMRATIPLEARRGRASYLGPRSVGHQDPGATSAHLLLKTAAETFGGNDSE
jgi:dihydroxyacetone kinase-like protein